jgi:hypothetical protein
VWRYVILSEHGSLVVRRKLWPHVLDAVRVGRESIQVFIEGPVGVLINAMA